MREELRATFRPEFLNRIDETIVFRRLDGEDMLRITRMQLHAIRARFAALGLTLEVPEETARFLARTGTDLRFGARPLRRTVQHSLEDAAAELLLEGRARAGDRIRARVENERLILDVERGRDGVSDGAQVPH